MRRWLVPIVSAAVLLSATASIHAAPSIRIVVTDPAGDANGINDQGLPIGNGGPLAAFHGAALPKNADDDLDILSVGFSTEWGKVGKTFMPSTLNVTLSLAGNPVGDNLPREYKIYFDTTPGCLRNWVLWQFVPTVPGVPDRVGAVPVITRDLVFHPGPVCVPTDRASTDDVTIKGVVIGTSLVFKIPAVVLSEKASKSIAGWKIANVRAESQIRPRNGWPAILIRTNTVGTYADVIADVAFDPNKTYVVGS